MTPRTLRGSPASREAGGAHVPRSKIAAILMLALLSVAAMPLASPMTTQSPWSGKIFGSTIDAYDDFGLAIDTDGARAIVGARGDDDAASAAGAAYVFVRQEDGQYVEEAKLVASDLRAGDSFGSAVAIDGDTAVVGARYHANPFGLAEGAVYVFARAGDAWFHSQTLTVPRWGFSSYSFGVSVSLDGGRLLAGASERAFVFEQGAAGTWQLAATLSDATPAYGDLFGWSVALDGDTAVVSAPYTDTNGTYSGAAYVFHPGPTGNWSVRTPLVPPATHVADHFGWSVATNGERVVVGTYAEDHVATDAGAAHVFARGSDDAWTHEARLVDATPEYSDFFGQSVAISGDAILVGAFQDTDPLCYRCGAAFLYRHSSSDGWVLGSKWLARDGETSNHYGATVALEGTSILIGAPWSRERGQLAGAVYVENVIRTIQSGRAAALLVAGDALTERVADTGEVRGEENLEVYAEDELLVLPATAHVLSGRSHVITEPHAAWSATTVARARILLPELPVERPFFGITLEGLRVDARASCADVSGTVRLAHLVAGNTEASGLEDVPPNTIVPLGQGHFVTLNEQTVSGDAIEVVGAHVMGPGLDVRLGYARAAIERCDEATI